MGAGALRFGRVLVCGLVALLMTASLAPAKTNSPARELGAAPAAQRLSLVFPLRADTAGLRRFAEAVTTPGSPDYGHYESVAALSRRFGATARDRRRVVAYLRSHGAGGVRVDATGLFAQGTMSVARAEALFATGLSRFRTAAGGRFMAPNAPVRVPAVLGGALTGVLGLDTKPVAGATSPAVHTDAHTSSGYKVRTGTPAGCPSALATNAFTPNQYLTAYGASPLRQSGLLGQDERVALIEIDGFRASDVHGFASCFGLPVPKIEAFGVGIKKALKPGPESTLDLEVLDSVAPRLRAMDVYESGSTSAAVVRSLAAPLENSGKKPQVISASLSVCEPALFASLSTAGIETAEGALEIAAASGISILSATGDSGSSGCIGPDGPIAAKAINYPAASWWVTGVGGTNATLNPANQITSQVAWNDAPDSVSAGGGGLSQLFRRPSYQKGFEAQNVRALPDVSMLADVEPGYAIFCTIRPDCVDNTHPDPWLAVGGTSAGTPLLAGGLALVDQYLRMHGRQDLGLANSLLYRIGRSAGRGLVLSDVSQGDIDLGPFLSSGDGRPVGCCTAKTGFDLATGLGTVNVGALAAVAGKLQPKIVNVGLSLPRNQHALTRHRMLATVSCSGQCLLASFARVKAGRKSFLVKSNVALLRRRGHRTLKLHFSKGQLRSLLAAHGGSATVFGVIVDAGGNIEKRSRGRKLRIGP